MAEKSPVICHLPVVVGKGEIFHIKKDTAIQAEDGSPAVLRAGDEFIITDYELNAPYIVITISKPPQKRCRISFVKLAEIMTPIEL